MGSRVKDKAERLFEVFVEIAQPKSPDEAPFILQQYPPDYQDKEALMMIPKFAYPCPTDASKVDHFTFVLTDLDSMFRFGCCRHTTGHQTCLCIVSWLPWFEIFYKMLDLLADITNSSKKKTSVFNFLEATFNHDVPLPGVSVTIVANENMFSFVAPDPNVLPSIPGSRNLTEYFSALDPYNMMVVFASMLHERRIYMTSKKLSRLTACIHAAEALLYPMHWQHLYIPVLPAHLIDYVSAPMPYLIGVHSNLVGKLKQNRVDVGDAVIVDLDKNAVFSEYDDLGDLPEDVSSHLKKNLKINVVKNNMKTGDTISMAFLHALVRLIGGYRDALKFRRGEPITFDPAAFVRSRSSQSTQAFLEGMLTLQIFQQFIYGRLEILNSGAGFRDVFEQQAILYEDKRNSQSKYKEWLKSVKKSGKKGWKGFKVIVKVQGKKAMADFKTKISGLTENDERRGSDPQVQAIVAGKKSKPRPVTTHVESERRTRPPRPPPPSSTSHHVEYDKRAKSAAQFQSDQKLGYQRVDMNLMTDTDIQAAMLKVASDEKTHNKSSNSSSEVGSRSSYSEDEVDAASITFDIINSSNEDLNLATSSNEKVHQQKNPDISVRSDKRFSQQSELLLSHNQVETCTINPKAAATSSRRKSSSMDHMPTISPSHRSTSNNKFEQLSLLEPTVLQDSPLVKLGSSELDSSDSESCNMSTNSATESPTASQASRSVSEESLEDSSEPEMRPIQRDITTRVSLTRSKAFRRETPTVPLRMHYLDDKEDLDGSRDNLSVTSPNPVMDSKLSSNNQTSHLETQRSFTKDPLSSHRRNPDLLTHEWSLAMLAKGPSIKLPISEHSRFPANLSTVGSSRTLPSSCQTKPRTYFNQRSNQSLDMQDSNFSQKFAQKSQHSLDLSKLSVATKDRDSAAKKSYNSATIHDHNSALSMKTLTSTQTSLAAMSVATMPTSSTFSDSKSSIQRQPCEVNSNSSSSASKMPTHNQQGSLFNTEDVEYDSNKSIDNPAKLKLEVSNRLSQSSEYNLLNNNHKGLPSRPIQPDTNNKSLPPRPLQPDTNHKGLSSRATQPDINHKGLHPRPLQPDTNNTDLPSRPIQPDTDNKGLPHRTLHHDTNHKGLSYRPIQPNTNLKGLLHRSLQPDTNHKSLTSGPLQPDTYHKGLPPRYSQADINHNGLPTRPQQANISHKIPPSRPPLLNNKH